MAPRKKRPGLFIHLVLRCQIANHPNWNELAKLMKRSGAVFGWRWTFSFFHNGFLDRKPSVVSQLLNSYGMAVEGIYKFKVFLRGEI